MIDIEVAQIEELLSELINDPIGILEKGTTIISVITLIGSFIIKCINSRAYIGKIVGRITNDTKKKNWKRMKIFGYQQLMIICSMFIMLGILKTAVMIINYRFARGGEPSVILLVLVIITLILFNSIIADCFKCRGEIYDRVKRTIFIGCDLYLLAILFLSISENEGMIWIIMGCVSWGLTACVAIIGYQIGLYTDYIVMRVIKMIRYVMLTVCMILIFGGRKVFSGLLIIAFIWIFSVVIEFAYNEKQDVKYIDVTIITTYGEYVTQRAIKRYQGNKVQYKTTKKETFILDLEEIEKIEYRRPNCSDRERKKLEKKEVKCELCNGTILRGNAVKILNEDWIRLKIQENTDILVKILKCKDVRKVETIHK